MHAYLIALVIAGSVSLSMIAATFAARYRAPGNPSANVAVPEMAASRG